MIGGLGPSITAAVLSLLVYDFFFVQPLYTFTVTKPQDLLSLFVFLVVAVLTSNLTARIRDQAEAARRREERTAALYRLQPATRRRRRVSTTCCRSSCDTSPSNSSPK